MRPDPRQPTRALVVAVTLCGALLGARHAGAQEEIIKRGDVTVFAGARLGGTVSVEEIDATFALGSQPSYGFLVDINVRENYDGNMFLEFAFSNQIAELTVRSGFDKRRAGDVAVRYYRGGAGFEWGRSRIRPFAVGTVGVTHFSPRTSLVDGAVELSLAGGGGVKVMLNRFFGFRVDARLHTTRTGISETTWWCGLFACAPFSRQQWIFQGELIAGLVIGF